MNSQNLLNDDLVQKIYDRIKWDIRVNTSDILLKADEGHIVLSGYFDKDYRHIAALEIIRSTDGVREVTDRSQVIQDYFRTDYELKKLVQKQLKTFQLLPGEWIDVDVAEGVVTLNGLVFRPRLKGFAASDSWGLSGIKDCINMIEVKASPTGIPEKKWFDIEKLSKPENVSYVL